MNETLGSRIAALRREKGLKQDELAEKLGVSPQAVSKWENDISCPDISLLPALAELLGVTVDELLSGKKEPPVELVPEKARKDMKDMILRVVVDSTDGDKVRVNLPIPLIQAAIDMGMESKLTEGHGPLKGIDIQQLLAMVKAGLVGNLVEVDSADGDKVRIFVE
ncbi:MAG: helix-turn-helix transcriptional regulator [Ruminococcaceae bacterium]|nr:helix-turn-helix transcriptional regulator [Oscillospiraceae bacterium]